MFIRIIRGKSKLDNLLYQKHPSNAGAKMIKYSAIKIWSRIPSEIKNKTCSALFSAEYKIYALLGC